MKKGNQEMENVMDEKMKELIAIGAAIGAHCQPCLTYHVNKAKEIGLDADLIKAAVEVGFTVEKGAMSAMRDFAKGIISGVNSPAATPGCCSGGK